jgi:hypothetical protein
MITKKKVKVEILPIGILAVILKKVQIKVIQALSLTILPNQNIHILIVNHIHTLPHHILVQEVGTDIKKWIFRKYSWQN